MQRHHWTSDQELAGLISSLGSSLLTCLLIIAQKFERPPLNKKPTLKFLSNQETHQLSPLKMCKVKNIGIYHYLLDFI